MTWLKPVLPVLLLTVMLVLPCCACGGSSFLMGTSTDSLAKRTRCDDIDSLPTLSLKTPFIIGNKKACFSDLNPPALTTIMQTLPFILSQLWQEASGVPDFLFSTAGQGLAFAQWSKKNSPAPEKVFEALTQDLVSAGDRVSLKKQFLELIDNQQQLTKEKENPSFYITIINEKLRAVVVPGQVIPELLLNPVGHWLLDAELALYLQILPEADWLDLQPELEAITSVSPTSAAGGDDGDPNREPDNDPEPALFIAGKFGIEPWVAGLYSQAVLQKQRLLSILRQRARQAIANGNRDLARTLQNLIMVIEADLSDLENSESQVSDNLALQALLLEGLLEISDEVRVYATKNRAVEAPTDQKESVSDGGGATSLPSPSKQQSLIASDGKPGSPPHNFDSSDNNPGPEHLQHTYNNQPCPVCRAEMCKETEPGSVKELGISNQRHILALPKEILMHIFKYTSYSERSAIMQCCKRFAEAVADKKVFDAQIQILVQEKPLDIVFPVGEAMSKALEAKTKFALNNASPVVKQTLVHFYNLAPVFCTHTLRVQGESCTASISCVAALADDRIVSGSLDSMVRVWRIKTDGGGVCTHTLQGHTDSVTSIATLLDRWVISGSTSGTIKIWNLNRSDRNYCTDTFEAHTMGILSIKTLPDMRFYSASFDNRVNMWFLTREGRSRRYQHVLSVMGGTSCLKVFPDGQLFAGTHYGYLYLWKTTEINEAPLTRIWVAHEEQVKCIEMLPNGQLLTCSINYEIKGWDFKKPKSYPVYVYKIPSSTPNLRCIKISPDGQMIIFSKLPYMQIVTFKNSEVDSVYTQEKGDDLIISITFLYDGRMVTGSFAGRVRVWDYSDYHHPKQP